MNIKDTVLLQEALDKIEILKAIRKMQTTLEIIRVVVCVTLGLVLVITFKINW